MMRICSMISVRDGLKSWGATFQELIDEVVESDVEVTLRDLPDAPVNMVMNARDHDLVAPHNIEAAIQAEREGFDAITTGCMLDPGIEGMRESVNRLAVVGDCQAVMHMGSLLGRRISVLLPSETATGLIRHEAFENLVRKYGFSDKLASIRGVESTSLEFAAGREELPERMLKQARLAIRDEGADVIVGYGNAQLLERLRANLPVPVIESVQCTISLATALVRHRVTHAGLMR